MADAICPCGCSPGCISFGSPVSWVRSMRYQMLVYPALALFAAWGLVKLWSARKEIKIWFVTLKPKLIRIVGIVLDGGRGAHHSCLGFCFQPNLYPQPTSSGGQ